MIKKIIDNAKQYINSFFDAVDTQAIETVVSLCRECEGLLIITGVGKSGIIAEKIAHDLERRIVFRRAAKGAITKAMSSPNVLGIKVIISGRLGGAEIARTEWYLEGKVPLHTWWANVENGFAEAETTYGIIGVKVIVNQQLPNANKNTNTKGNNSKQLGQAGANQNNNAPVVAAT